MKDIVSEISIDDNRWLKYCDITNDLIIRTTSLILDELPNYKTLQKSEISILLTSDKRMKDLNTRFRHISKATNVLSFPNTYIDPYKVLDFIPKDQYMYLGDIAFGFEIIKKESLEQSKDMMNHFIHLLVHGILHLLGFDHYNDILEFRMRKLEESTLDRMNIDSPYTS